MVVDDIRVGDIVWYFVNRHNMRFSEQIAGIVVKQHGNGVVDLHLFASDVPGSIPRASVRHHTLTDWPPLSEEQGCWCELNDRLMADYQAPKKEKAAV